MTFGERLYHLRSEKNISQEQLAELLDVCRQVDNRDKPYDVEILHRMYDYLTAHGECYYIEYKGVLVGDVSLRENSEIAIVVCKEYQNPQAVGFKDYKRTNCDEEGNPYPLLCMRLV